MSVTESVDKFLRISHYAKRAWTMQEELCSSRLLIFVNGQAYFRCQGASFNEELVFRKGALSYSDINIDVSYSYLPHIFSSIYSDGQGLDAFTEVMNNYLRRKLTYERDTIRATTGMFRKLSSSMGLKFIHGLPAPLEWSLLFFPANLEKATRIGRRAGFPSFSWTGWLHVSFWQDDQKIRSWSFTREKAKRTWIVWFTKPRCGALQKIDSQGNAVPAHEYPVYESYAQEIAKEFQSLSSLLKTPLQDTPPILPLQFDLLCFWTVSIYLRISLAKSSNENILLDLRGSHSALGTDDALCGSFIPDTKEEINPDNIYEFVLISEYEDSLRGKTEIGYFGLLIKEIGQVVERRGLLKIPHQALEKTYLPGPRLRNVVLN